jgi:hypothetical protein
VVVALAADGLAGVAGLGFFARERGQDFFAPRREREEQARRLRLPLPAIPPHVAHVSKCLPALSAYAACLFLLRPITFDGSIKGLQ